MGVWKGEDGFFFRMGPEGEGAGVGGCEEGVMVEGYDMVEGARRLRGKGL